MNKNENNIMKETNMVYCKYSPLLVISVPEMYGRPQVVKVKPCDLTMTLTDITLDMQVINTLNETHDRGKNIVNIT